MMKVLIYGSGAVGLGLASALLDSGIEVDLVSRTDTVESLRNSGLRLSGIFGEKFFKPEDFQVSETLSDFAHKSYDFILVCTKSFDSGIAAKDLSQYPEILAANGYFLLCQNGWGNAQEFLRFFNAHKILNARIITGFYRPKRNEVEITVHADDIHIGSLFGPLNQAAEELANLITQGGIPCSLTDKIEEDLWSKMLYNCALNPLGAICRVPYGKLAESEDTVLIMNHIIEEVFQVVRLNHFKNHWQKPEDYLKLFYSKLIPLTKNHESSMLQDIRSGRPTEIQALNGQVIHFAEKKGISVPYNQSVYSMVRFVEKSD